ncbi:MAG TPA: glycosyltransferase [Fluviicola sp.]|nr:glycosyltransferase [Fluviicola sp.]
MSKPKVIVSVINDLSTDQRVHKVCTFLIDQGYDVLLVGRKKRDSLPLTERAYATRRMKLYFEKGALFYAFFNLRLFFFLLFRKSQLLLSNDLDTLLPNKLVSGLKNIPLVYDSHEYFTEVPELLDRPKVRRVWERIEQYCFPKLKTVYTVNRSIADKYEQKYHVPVNVVRNVSPLWRPEVVPPKSELGIPENKRLLIMQGAGLNIHRGIEEAIAMMHHLNDAVLMLVGDGDIIPAMKQRVEAEKLTDIVLFFGKRPYAELMFFTFHADLGLSLDQPTNPNYEFSLPNKVFDYMHAGTPVVCSNVVEVARLVKQHDLGLVLDDYTPQHMADEIGNLLSDTERMQQLKANCEKAALVENWEKETEILQQIYTNVR